MENLSWAEMLSRVQAGHFSDLDALRNPLLKRRGQTSVSAFAYSNCKSSRRNGPGGGAAAGAVLYSSEAARGNVASGSAGSSVSRGNRSQSKCRPKRSATTNPIDRRRIRAPLRIWPNSRNKLTLDGLVLLYSTYGIPIYILIIVRCVAQLSVTERQSALPPFSVKGRRDAEATPSARTVPAPFRSHTAS